MGYPKGKNEGYFVKPTIFTNVNYNMKIFNEEIFGTVLVILPYDNEEEAINIANSPTIQQHNKHYTYHTKHLIQQQPTLQYFQL